jgi:hypothetical protein
MKKIYTDLYLSLKPKGWVIIRFIIYLGVALPFYFFEQKVIFKIIIVLSIMSIFGPMLTSVCGAIAFFVERNYFRLIHKKNSMNPEENLKDKYKSIRQLYNDLKVKHKSIRQLYNDQKVKHKSIRQLYNDLKVKHKSIRQLYNDLKVKYKSIRQLYNDQKVKTENIDLK